MKSICALLIASLFFGIVEAESDPSRARRTILAEVKPAAAQYLLQVQLVPREGILRTWMELTYTNSSTKDIETLWFSAPDESELRIDSILYLGAPLDSTRIRRDKQNLGLNIQLKPGEMAPLLLSFASSPKGVSRTLRKGQPAFFSEWYPVLCTQSAREKGASDDTSLLVPEIGDFRVEISVDTPFQVVAPGLFLNDIEFIGSLSDRIDSIYPDPMASTGSVAFEGRSRLKFHFLSTGAERFTFAVMKHPSMVRAMTSKQRVDCYWPGIVPRHLQVEYAEDASSVVREICSLLGPLPDNRCAALFDRIGYYELEGNQLIVLSSSNSSKQNLLVEFTWQLARRYFHRAEESRNSLPWEEGAAVWVTAVVMHNLYGGDGYAMMSSWLDQKLPISDHWRNLSYSPFSWMNNVRRPNQWWGPEDTLRFEQLFVVPSALQMLAATSSTDSVMTELCAFSLANRNRHPNSDELSDSLHSAFGIPWVGVLEAVKGFRKSFDPCIENVAIERVGDQFRIAVDAKSPFSIGAPLNVALICGSDTLISTLVPVAGKELRSRIEAFLDCRPSTIVLDPLQSFPDRNRQNNVYQTSGRTTRYKYQQAEFPTFRRLVAGD